MDRVSGDGARHVNFDPTGQQIPTPPPLPHQAQPQPPVMRQQQTDHTDYPTDVEKISHGDVSLPLIDKHSEPHVSNRTHANPASLQLDPIDQENFVYTKKQFNEALDHEDAKALVRMLRHGKLHPSENWRNGDTYIVCSKLISTNKPELLAELVRESSLFESGFCNNVICIQSPDEFIRIWDFIEAVNDHRELPKTVREVVLGHCLNMAVSDESFQLFDIAIQKEKKFFRDEGYKGYDNAIRTASRSKKMFCEPLIQNLFTNQSVVKSGIDVSTCAFAAGIASAVGRLDLALKLQDKVLQYEEAMRAQNESVEHESLGARTNYVSVDRFLEILTDYVDGCDVEKFKGSNTRYLIAKNLYGNHAPEVSPVSDDFLVLQTLRQSLIQQCIRPGPAEIIARLCQKCYVELFAGKQMAANDDSTEASEGHSETDDESVEADRKRLPVLLASQWESLFAAVDAEDELAALQMSHLEEMGQEYINHRLGSIPELVDTCFEFVDVELALDAQQVQTFLVNRFDFPDSLARFLARSMSAAVEAQTTKPVSALPSGMAIKDVGNHLRIIVKTNASQEFKANFSTLIRQQELISLLREDAEGRNELWHNFFYAYLDVLKEALPSPRAAQ